MDLCTHMRPYNLMTIYIFENLSFYSAYATFAATRTTRRTYSDPNTWATILIGCQTTTSTTRPLIGQKTWHTRWRTPGSQSWFTAAVTQAWSTCEPRVCLQWKHRGITETTVRVNKSQVAGTLNVYICSCSACYTEQKALFVCWGVSRKV